jgi:hypothetical protein
MSGFGHGITGEAKWVCRTHSSREQLPRVLKSARPIIYRHDPTISIVKITAQAD